MSYVLISKKQAQLLWGERKEYVSLVSYYRSAQVNTTNTPVLHHSGSVWSIGTISSNLGMLNPAPHVVSCTRNASRWHRSPAVGHWKHHLSLAVSGRQPGEVFPFNSAFEGTTVPMHVHTLLVLPHDEWGWICQMQWLRRSIHLPRALSLSSLCCQTCY